MREQRRIKRKKQRLIFMFLFTVIVIILMFQILSPLTTEAHEPIRVVQVTVEKGDTLWEIADRYDNNKMDLRQYIYVIEKYNTLNEAVLQPGQRLEIPIY